MPQTNSIDSVSLMPGPSLLHWLRNISAHDRKDQVTDEMLEDCGVEAIGNGSLSRSEIGAVYHCIKRADKFLSRLKSRHVPEDLMEEYIDGRGKLRMRWSKLGAEFIHQLAHARKIVDFLNFATPHRTIAPKGEASKLCDENGIPFIVLPIFESYLKPHPCIQALIDASPSFDMVFGGYPNAEKVKATESTYQCLAEAFKAFVEPGQLEALKRASDNLRRKCNKNYNSLKNYLKGLLKRYKRLVVVRLDLYYRHPYAQDSRVCTHQRIGADRVQFLNMIRRNYPAFVGYAWKFEVGVQRHWHAHMLLCFDGNRARLDAVIGRRLGEAWVRLTEGQGDYFNCNGKRHRYKHDAIGDVEEKDPGKVALLLGYPVTYLTKPDYFAGLVLEGGARTYGKGQLPREKKKIVRRKRVPRMGVKST